LEFAAFELRRLWLEYSRVLLMVICSRMNFVL
jgi:hypothetical protein